MNFRKQRSRSRRNSVNVISQEKWRNVNRRMSRRGEAFDPDNPESESDEENSKQSPDNWEQEFSRRKKHADDNSDEDVEVQLTKKQTLLLSTLVPDEILKTEKFNSNEPKRFVGVLLMADVSGYTALSERYNNAGKGGTYRLTVTLNTYLGSLIELIYNHGGDILKFAGDAFLALWKTDKSTFIGHTIHTAVACALLIQHSFSSYETDVKVNLKVKLAISAGNLVFATIGNKIPMNYVVFGLPVIEAKLAESVCNSGEVKLTPNAWGHLYSRNYDHNIHEDGHVTIKAILYDPREKDVSKPFGGFGATIKIKSSFCALENLPESIWSESLTSLKNHKKHDALSFRKSILLAVERNIGAEIRKFMIRPVLTQVDAHQPLEYLTEMRQVSVLFVTLKPANCPILQLITIVNNSYQIMCEIVYKSMGCVNKIILFDKDVMILIIFGLRGFKHESEAQAALKCAYSIKKSVSALAGVQEVSIGVTTGQVYCGVVGHPLRREFTVIGATVNKAARLMCYFRNMITCDESTFVKSKMSTNGFTLQPEANLKGIVNAGKIYEYTEEIRVKQLYDIPMILPLLDRIDEMEYFKNWLDDAHNSYRDFDALLLVGESRLGKSRLLEWMARESQNSGYKVSTVSLTSIHSASPYLALTQILNQILDIEEPNENFHKEEKIVNLLQVYDDDLCYLNDVLKVRFAYHEGIYSQDVSQRVQKAKSIFGKLINCLPETQVVFLDDLQNLDPVSWEYIMIMTESMKVFTVLSVCRGKFSSVHTWLYSVFINNNIRKIVLCPLAPQWIPPLACQILNVDAVPDDLCQALQIKCKGQPGLVEMLLVHLFSSGALNVKKVTPEQIEELKDENLQFPDPELLHPQALKSEDQEKLNKFIEEEKEIGVCLITQKDELNTDINVQNLDALVMIQIDSLTPYQQLLLKTASVIGNVLSRDLLENIMYENNPITTAKAIKRLFSMRILTCANIRGKWQRKKQSSTLSIPSNVSIINDKKTLTCECIFDYDSENIYDLPKYAFCKVMKFRNRKSRLAFYELLPMNQKKEFHARVVNYLQNNKHKCPQCGGALMVAQSEIGIDQTENCAEPSQENEEDEDGENEDGKIDEVQNTPENYKESHKDDVRKSTSESILSNLKYDTTQYNNRHDSMTQQASGHNSIQSGTSSFSNAQHNPILKSSHDSASTRRRSVKRVTVSSFVYSTPSADNDDKSVVFDMLREITEAESINDWHKLGIVDSDDDEIEARHIKYKRFFSIKVEKGVSQTNFSQCTCAELKIIIYEQIVYHAKRAEMKFTEIEFLIKLSYLHVLIDNINDALPRLEEAEINCTSAEVEAIIDPTDIQRFLGKIYSIKAAIFLATERLAFAKIAIGRAMRIYRINLEQFFNVSHLIKSVRFKQKKYRLHEAKMAADSIFCLNIATMLYSSMGDGVSARISAYRAIKLAQKVDCSVVDMCDAFSNALQIDLMLGYIDATAETERLSILCLQRLPSIKAEELYAFGKLFMSAFRARVARGQLASAVHSGFRALTVSRFLRAENVSIEIIPDLSYILLSRRRVEEAVDVVKEAQHLDDGHQSLDSRTWYFALCIDLILDAGFQLEPPSKISRYAEETKHMTRAENGRRRLVVGLWTYWLRADLEKKAKSFEAEALSWMQRPEEDGSLASLISSMRLAEGMLECLARKMDDLRKVVDLMELRSLADRELIKLENDAKICRAIYPRWILLKANSLKLSGRQSAAAPLFNQALDEARKIHNRLEEAIARASFSNSPFWLQSARSGSFMGWQDAAPHARSSWHHLMYKITTTRS